MIQFKISKTAFKNALEISKRTLSKNDSTGSFFISNNTELLILTPGDSILVYDYLPLSEKSESFAFTIQPAQILTELDGSDRALMFEIIEREDGTKTLRNCEKNVEYPIIKSGNPKTAFKDLRSMEFVKFENPTNVLDSINKAVATHQSSEERYTELVELKGNSFHSYNPLIYAEYWFGEGIEINEKLGVEGIGLDKKALDIFIKTVKTSKNLSYCLSDNPSKLFLKENNKIFAIGFILPDSDDEARSDNFFPSVNLNSSDSSFNLLEDSRISFHLNANEMNSALTYFKNDKVGKVTLLAKDGSLTIVSGLVDFPDRTIRVNFTLETPCSFQLPILKSFFKDLKGEVPLSYIHFVSNQMNDKKQVGYAIEYSDQEQGVLKIMPGIKSSEGY